MSAASIETMLSFILNCVWRASWQGSVLAALVLMIQSLFTRRLGGRGRYLLWSIVILRLLLPIVPQSKFSAFNLSLTRDSVDIKETSDFKSGISNSALLRELPSDAAEPAPKLSPLVRDEGVKLAVLLPRVILSVWLIGIAALSIRVMRECLRTKRLVRELREVSDAQVHGIVESCALSLHLHRLPRVVTGESIHTPAVVGIWRPALLLPARVLERCDRRQISMIVMHELAHLKRRDIAANWLVTVATIIHWFNPLVWLTAARIRADRELACDELVLSRAGSTGCDVQSYGNTLLALVELISPAPAQRQLVGILESSAPLERRIRMIARFDPKASGRWAWPAVILVVLSIAFLTDAVSGQGRGRRAGAPVSIGPATEPAETPVRPLSDDAVAAQLDKVIPEVKLDSVPLSDVIDFMRDISGANFVVEWRTLEAAGIEKSTLISVRLRNVSMGQALDHILRDAGGPVGYKVMSGAIVISTSDVSPPNQQRQPINSTETVFYDVSDLLEFSVTVQDVDAGMKTLRDAIHSVLLSHMREGENTGMMDVQSFGKKLIITTTPEHHQEVKYILAKLREKPATQPRSNSF